MRPIQPRVAGRCLARPAALAVTTTLVMLAGSAAATTPHCVDDPNDLKAALGAAQANGDDDEIMVVQGHDPTGPSAFLYSGEASCDLLVRGGCREGCTDRVPDPGTTVLDGTDLTPVLGVFVPSGTLPVVARSSAAAAGRPRPRCCVTTSSGTPAAPPSEATSASASMPGASEIEEIFADGFESGDLAAG